VNVFVTLPQLSFPHIFASYRFTQYRPICRLPSMSIDASCPQVGSSWLAGWVILSIVHSAIQFY